MFASSIGRPSTSGPNQRILALPGVVSIRQAKRPASALPAEGQRQPKKRVKRDRNRVQEDDTARVSTAESISEHAGQGQTFLSTRRDPALARTVSSLASLALSKSCALLPGLVVNDVLPPDVEAALKALPAHVAQKVVSRLLDTMETSSANSTMLLILPLISSSTTEFSLPLSVATQFSVTLPLIRRLLPCNLITLNMSAQMKLKDSDLAPLLRSSPHLKTLILRSCVKIGDATAELISQYCPALENLNLNFCSITHKGLAGIIGRLLHLRTLKIAAINGLSDMHVSQMIDSAVELSAARGSLPLSQLSSLKLKSSNISEVSCARFLTFCAPTLETLDISFIPIRTLDVLINHFFSTPQSANRCKLRKLNLSGLTLKSGTLLKFLKAVTKFAPGQGYGLEKLKLGSIGATLLATAGANEFLDSRMIPPLQAALQKCPRLSSLSLFGNERLMNSPGLLANLLSDISPRIRFLDLSNTILASSTTSGLRHRDLLGLIQDPDGFEIPSSIEALILDGTKVDDEALAVLHHCAQLQSLHIANSRISASGLQALLDSCPRLYILNLSGCRGIETRFRRDAFEAYQRGEFEDESS